MSTLRKTFQRAALLTVSVALISLTGCVDPDGRQNNTASGALIGGAVGALAGAATSGRHAGQNALIGALAGALVGGIVGHVMDDQQRERLREQSPQTLQVIQHNEQVAAQTPPPPPPSGQPAPPPAPADAPTPLKVSDIEALTAAGVKPDTIIEEIKSSKAPAYSDADIAAAQSATPPVDASVVAFMKNPAT